MCSTRPGILRYSVRVRVSYTKTGKARFVSAIDLGRVWERSLRRAELPIAYSEGFSPHPKVSFPDALPLGYASTGEYAELAFEGRIDLPAGVRALNAAFPDGVRVLHAVEVAQGDPRLSRWLSASLWELRYDPEVAATLQVTAPELLRADELFVDRDRKGELTRLDLRPSIHALATARGTLTIVLHHTEPPMRPSEVHQALATRAPGALPDPVLVTRLAQGRAEPHGLLEALSGRLELCGANASPSIDPSDPENERVTIP